MRPAPRPAPPSRAPKLIALMGLLSVILVGVGLALRAPAPAALVAGPGPLPMPPTDDPRALARGAEVVAGVGGCAGCHGPELRGGPIPDGEGAEAPDLVAGPSAAWTLEQRSVAVRDCLAPDGRPLRLMPCDQHSALALSDLSGALAHIARAPQRHTPPRAAPLDPAEPAPLRAETAAARPREAQPQPLPPAAVEPLGRYVYATTCGGCHGPYRAPGGALDAVLALPAASGPTTPIDARAPGGTSLDGRAAPALGGAAGRPIDRIGLSELMMTGLGRGGRPAHPAYLSRSSSALTDDEITALWTILSASAPPSAPSPLPAG